MNLRMKTKKEFTAQDLENACVKLGLDVPETKSIGEGKYLFNTGDEMFVCGENLLDELDKACTEEVEDDTE